VKRSSQSARGSWHSSNIDSSTACRSGSRAAAGSGWPRRAPHDYPACPSRFHRSFPACRRYRSVRSLTVDGMNQRQTDRLNWAVARHLGRAMDLAQPGTRRLVCARPPGLEGHHLLCVHTRCLSLVGGKRAPCRLVERAWATRRACHRPLSADRSGQQVVACTGWHLPLGGVGRNDSGARDCEDRGCGYHPVAYRRSCRVAERGHPHGRRAIRSSEGRSLRRSRRSRRSCAPALRDAGRHAVAKRECRRMAPDDDRVDRSRQKRYRPLGTGAGAGSGNRCNKTLFGADDGTRFIPRFIGTMNCPDGGH
jgi:hypothetical protein